MINTVLYIVNLIHLSLSDNPTYCLCNIYKSNVYDRALTSINYSPLQLTFFEKTIHIIVFGLYFISHLWLFIPFVNGVIIRNDNCTDLQEIQSITDIVVAESTIFMFYLISFIGLVASWYCINTNIKCDTKCEEISIHCQQLFIKNKNDKTQAFL